MKKTLLLFSLCFVCLFVLAQSDNTIALIPQPVSLEKTSVSFELNSSTQIVIPDKNEEISSVATLFSQDLAKATGFTMPVKKGSEAANNSISLVLAAKPETSLGAEGYRIETISSGVIITANKPAGLFYGLATLKQLLPKEIESKTVVKRSSWPVPGVKIIDYPRFTWRGMMFDVSRHFFTKAQVKEFIDEMVKYKFNLLHLHLTDDQGWRIEIKSLPKLTEVGAWNVKKIGTFGGFSEPGPEEPRDFGGFYTQNDLKELIQYAKERYVNILPEVDVPGHSMAAVASYPELSCTPGTYRVASGEKFMQWTDTGFFALKDNTLCPANEKVYEFLDKVFTEIAAIFPFEYIHMGGDECAKNFWEKSDAIKQLMKKEKLKDMHEVQSYFVKRVEKIISSKGKKLIGWDEILEGGLPENAAVMSWRGMKGGIEAAKQGHEVVMSPSTHVYIDLMQGDNVIEPPVYSSVLLKKSYEFEPIPDGVDPKLIKGGQANLWTEQIYNMRHLQYMVWPRTFAVSESLWSPKGSKNWNKFVGRVEKHFERFDIATIKYARSMYDPSFKASKEGNGPLKVELSTEVEGLDIYYSFDNSYPDEFYPKYSQVLTVPKDAVRLRVVTYRNGQQIGRQVDMPVTELVKRAARKK